MNAAHDSAGYSHIGKAMRFAAWASAQHKFPTYQAVMARWGCGRATAHRWLNALADARGIERPVHPNANNIPRSGEAR